MKILTTPVFLSKVAVVMFLLLFSPLQSVYAGAAINLSPATGTFSQNIFIDVVVNNTGDPVVGFDIDLIYTGPVEFSSYSAGTLGCGTLVVNKTTSGRLSILCLASVQSDGKLPNSGTIAKLVFRTTGNGTVSMTMQNADDSVVVDSLVGGNYTISNYVPSGTSYTTTTLPQASFLDDYPAVAGMAMLMIGAGTLAVFRRYDRFNKEEAYNTVSMSDKVKNY